MLLLHIETISKAVKLVKKIYIFNGEEIKGFSYCPLFLPSTGKLKEEIKEICRNSTLFFEGLRFLQELFASEKEEPIIFTQKIASEILKKEARRYAVEVSEEFLSYVKKTSADNFIDTFRFKRFERDIPTYLKRIYEELKAIDVEASLVKIEPPKPPYFKFPNVGGDLLEEIRKEFLEEEKLYSESSLRKKLLEKSIESEFPLSQPAPQTAGVIPAEGEARDGREKREQKVNNKYLFELIFPAFVIYAARKLKRTPLSVKSIKGQLKREFVLFVTAFPELIGREWELVNKLFIFADALEREDIARVDETFKGINPDKRVLEYVKNLFEREVELKPQLIVPYLFASGLLKGTGVISELYKKISFSYGTRGVRNIKPVDEVSVFVSNFAIKSKTKGLKIPPRPVRTETSYNAYLNSQLGERFIVFPQEFIEFTSDLEVDIGVYRENLKDIIFENTEIPKVDKNAFVDFLVFLGERLKGDEKERLKLFMEGAKKFFDFEFSLPALYGL